MDPAAPCTLHPLFSMPKAYVIFIGLKTLQHSPVFIDVDAAVEAEVVAELADGEAELVVDADTETAEPVVEFMDADAVVQVEAVAEFESGLAFFD